MRQITTLLLFSALAFAYPNTTGAISTPPTAGPVPAAAASDDASAAPMTLREARAAARAARKDMTRAERKSMRKQLREAMRSSFAADTNTILLVILAILIPPLAMFLYEGTINTRFWLSLLLTLLGGFPGIIYTVYIIGTGR